MRSVLWEYIFSNSHTYKYPPCEYATVTLMRYFILTGLLSISVFLVTPVFAANGLVPCNGPDCGSCELVTLASKILNFFIEVTVSIGAVMFVIGGLTMVMSAGDTGKVSKGKEMMSNAVIGLVIVLSAWLLMDTVLKMIVGEGSQAYGVWEKISCTTQTQPSAYKTVESTTAPKVGGSPTGVAGAVGVRDANGNIQQVAFPTSQSDASLSSNFSSVKSKYENQISSACQSSSIPNCTQVMTALIANESQGNPSAISPAGSVGIMQLLPANGGQTCSQSDTTCIQGQINKGVSVLSAIYANNNVVAKNIPNALAAYNGGGGTAEGSSASGKRPPLAPSQDCPGLLAYQCSINPGGLVESQKYVANICKTLTLQGSGC